MGAYKVLIATGLVMLGIGLLLGLIPSSIPGDSGKTISCGSPWVRSGKDVRHAEAVDELATVMSGGKLDWSTNWAGRCDDAIGVRGFGAGLLGGLGALILVGVGFLVAAQRGPAESQVRGSTDLVQP